MEITVAMRVKFNDSRLFYQKEMDNLECARAANKMSHIQQIEAFPNSYQDHVVEWARKVIAEHYESGLLDLSQYDTVVGESPENYLKPFS